LKPLIYVIDDSHVSLEVTKDIIKGQGYEAKALSSYKMLMSAIKRDLQGSEPIGIGCFIDLNMGALRAGLEEEHGNELSEYAWWNNRHLEGFAVSHLIMKMTKAIAATEKQRYDQHVNFFDENSDVTHQVRRREENLHSLREIVAARMVPLAVFHYSGTDTLDDPTDTNYSIQAGAKGFIRKGEDFSWEDIAPKADHILQKVMRERQQAQKDLEDEIQSQERCLRQLRERAQG